MKGRINLKVLFLVVVCSALIPPMLIGEPRSTVGVTGGDWWRNTIMDFQTLIAGILAVFAAWWTVSTMDRTEQKQEERHLDVLALQLQPKYTALSKLVETYGDEIKGYGVICKKLLEEILAAEFTGSAVIERGYQIDEIVQDIHSTLNSPELADASQFLNGPFLRACRFAVDICQSAQSSTDQLVEHLAEGKTQYVSFQHWFFDDVPGDISGMDHIVRSLQDLSGIMPEIASRFVEVENRLTMMTVRIPRISAY